MSTCSIWSGSIDRRTSGLARRRCASRAATRRAERAPRSSALAARRRRKPREPRVRAHEPLERLGAVVNDREARARVVAPIRRQRLAADELAHRARHRLDRRERAVELVTDDAHEALPRLPLFLAQRAAELRDHEQLVRLAAFAEAAAANFPAAAAAGKHVRDDAARGLGEHRGEPELRRAAALQGFDRAAEQRLAGAVDHTQAQRRVEREHGDIDVGDDLLQQHAGLERFEPLVVQRAAQRVHLDHDFAERVLRIDVAAAHRVVAFAQRFEHVRERLQRAHDVAPHGDEADQHEQAEESQDRPAQPAALRRTSTAARRRRPRPGPPRASEEQHAVLEPQALAPRSQSEFFHAPVQRRAAHAELVRRGDDVTVVARQRGANRLLLDLVERHRLDRRATPARPSSAGPRARSPSRAP